MVAARARWPLYTAALALAAYAAFRAGMETSLRAAGADTGGLLAYDSYYPLAFARELGREGSLFLFGNPFGTLDSEPGLVSVLASALHLAEPLWSGDLLAFDIALGASASVAAGALVGLIAARIGRQPPVSTALVLVVVVAGGGVGFVGMAAGALPERSAEGLLNGAVWGLTWVTNQTLTWELVYHAFFWTAVWGLVTGRPTPVAVGTAALAALHPFTLGVLAIVATAAIAVHRRRPGSRRTVALAAPILAVTVLVVVGYEIVLPAVSDDARFLRDVYEQTSFRIAPVDLLLFTAPVLLVLATVFAGSAGRRPAGHEAGAADASGWHAVFLLSAGGLLVLALSPAVTDIVPQPAHWTRVYLIAFLGLAALAVPGPTRRGVTAILAVVATVAMADSFAARPWLVDAVLSKGPPAAMAPDTRAVVDRLASLEAGRFAYLRRCGRPGYTGSVEYSVAALTPHRVALGHVYFTPGLEARLLAFEMCPRRTPLRLPPRTWVLTDVPLGVDVALAGRERIGRYVLGSTGPGTATVHP